MTGSWRPRLAIWTPLPPQPSGIAAHNAELLLPRLATLADVSVVLDDELIDIIEPPLGVTVLPRSAFEPPASDRDFDLHIYHLGNHHGLHGAIHDQLLRTPGLLILHDQSLFDFYHVRHQGGPGVDDEIAYNYGDTFANLPTVRVGTNNAPDRLALRLVRRVVEASLGVVVHTEWARAELTARFPTKPIFHIPLAAPLLDLRHDGPDMRARLGWADTDVVFALVGSFARHKRIDLAARLFGAVHRDHPDTRLLIVGRLDVPEELARLQSTIAANGLGSTVEVITNADSVELDACLVASDTLVDLRWPTAGETPATLMRAFGAGKPGIITDLPQLREFDERFCWRVPAQTFETASAVIRRMTSVARDPASTRECGFAARDYIAHTATPDIVSSRYLEVIETVAHASSTTSPPSRPQRLAQPIGVSVLGDFDATTGLMEAGRRMTLALVAAGVDVELTMLETAATRSTTSRLDRLSHLPHGRRYPIDLWLLNLNEFLTLSDTDLRPPDFARYTIGYWFWEMPTIPPPFDEHVARVDEIWVGSRFVRDALRTVAPRDTPITVIHPTIDVPSPRGAARSHYGLPDDAVIFFSSFDARSSPARKNPWGVIDAFEHAFSEHERAGPVRLALKVNHLEFVPRLRDDLEAAVKRVNGILIEDELTRQDMNGLLASIDVFCSLHRAEGFGLLIAESMHLGKPVIVTAYSGNLDFTTSANSCLVGYELRDISDTDHVHHLESATIYQPGILWAEPSVSQAVQWMRLLYENPRQRHRIGNAAAHAIRDLYSADRVQKVLVQRLEKIAGNLDDGGRRLDTVGTNRMAHQSR